MMDETEGVTRLDWGAAHTDDVMQLPHLCGALTNKGWNVVQVIPGFNALKMPVYVVLVNRPAVNPVEQPKGEPS